MGYEELNNLDPALKEEIFNVPVAHFSNMHSLWKGIKLYNYVTLTVNLIEGSKYLSYVLFSCSTIPCIHTDQLSRLNLRH